MPLSGGLEAPIGGSCDIRGNAQARKGVDYALTAAIRPGTPTRVMARLML